MAVARLYRKPVGLPAMKTTSKTVIFYKNGDVFSKYPVTITPRKYRSFDILLAELSMKTELPQGVRYLLDKENGAQVKNIEDLQDGKEYVCASNARLKRLAYGKKGLPGWRSKQHIDLPPITNPPPTRNLGSTGSSDIRTHYRRIETKAPRRLEPLKPNTASRTSVKPRIVSVYRNGKPKESAKKVLLNKRTAQTLDQVLDEVNHVFGPSSGSNVQKLYTTGGKLITTVAELFRENNGIFIAVGSERFKADDLESINAEDAKQVTSHQRVLKLHHGNEGIRHNRDIKHHPKHQDVSPKASTDNALPKITDSNNNRDYSHTKADNNNKDLKSPNERKPQSPKYKRPLGKQTDSTGNASKHTNAVENNVDSVKLPKIGDGHLVTKQQETIGQENEGQITSPRDPPSEPVRETGRKHSKEEKPIVKKKRSSKESSSGLEEEQYSRVTDKEVTDVYNFGQKLGDGNFAIVRQCKDKITQKEFAIKIIDKRKIRGKEKMIDDEIAIMRRCRHPNIVRLFEDYDSATEIYLVMELIKGGDLFDAISSSVKFTEHVAKSYFRDMCKALAYLHKRKIVHRDLKPENLLVHKRSDGQTHLKLADFGLAMEVTAPIFTVCGTPTYVAPEILEENGYGLKVDMWAAGVITYIMLCGFPPFRSPNRDQDELFDLIQSGEFEFLSPYWDPVSDDAKDLISTMLVVDPTKRATADQVLQHRWARQKSPTVEELSKRLLENGDERKKKKFKTAAIAIRGAKRLENLVVDFHREKFISTS